VAIFTVHSVYGHSARLVCLKHFLKPAPSNRACLDKTMWLPKKQIFSALAISGAFAGISKAIALKSPDKDEGLVRRAEKFITIYAYIIETQIAADLELIQIQAFFRHGARSPFHDISIAPDVWKTELRADTSRLPSISLIDLETNTPAPPTVLRDSSNSNGKIRKLAFHLYFFDE
jgi:hypothetical protein